MQQAKVREIREKILIIYLNHQVALDVDAVMRKWTKKHGEGSEHELLSKVEERYGKAISSEPELEPEPEPEPELEPEPDAPKSAELSAAPRRVMLPMEEDLGQHTDAGRDALPAEEGQTSTYTATVTAPEIGEATNGPERSIFDENDDDWLEAGGFDSPSPPGSPASPTRDALTRTAHRDQKPSGSDNAEARQAKPTSAATNDAVGRHGMTRSGTTSFADFQRASKTRATKAVSARQLALERSDMGNGTPRRAGHRRSAAAAGAHPSGTTSRGSPAGRGRGRAAGRRNAARAKDS